jgi:hypothetical protein
MPVHFCQGKKIVDRLFLSVDFLEKIHGSSSIFLFFLYVSLGSNFGCVCGLIGRVGWRGGGRGEGKLLLVQGRSVGERFAQIDIFLLITSAHCYPAHKNNGIF